MNSFISHGALAMCLAAATSPAFAQDDASVQSGGIEEIVVTAQKRSESLQKTPISMMAMTGADIEKKGIADITDLRTLVPSLAVTPHPNSATTARVFIRGIGNNDDQITVDPSVAVYLDGIYIARNQGLSAEVAEVERIEVLRGPQGSLYGRNATGGAINYITRAAELGEFSAKQTLAIGNYDQFRSRTRVNIPVGEALAVELGYLHSQKDGFVGNPGTGVDRWGDQRRDAYRAAVLWQPTDALQLRYTYDRSDINDTPVFMVAAPFYPRMADRPTAGSPLVRNLMPNDATSQGHNLTISWEVADDVTLRSLTGYRKLSSITNQNYLTGVAGPFPLILTGFDQKQDQWSEELQLVGSAFDRRLDYVLGAYYFDEDGESSDYSAITGRPRMDRVATIHNRAYALYGQATLRPAFMEGLYLTGGLRWSRDERKATLDQTIVPATGSPTVLPRGAGDNHFSNISPSLVIGYNANANLNIYAKYARGYKTGGYNIRASSIARFNEGFGPETLDSFELGIKSSWLDNHLQANLALFRSNYKDIQTNIQSDPTNVAITDVFNAGKARIQGFELDLIAKPIDALTLSVNYAYLDAKFQQILDQAGNDITSRYTFVEAPKHTLTTSLEYRFPDTPIGVLTANIDYFLKSKVSTSTADPRYVIGDYGLLNARLTLSDIPVGFGSWRLSAFGKNLTDKEYYIAHFNGGLPSAIFGDPRTYGLELTFEY
ncbi:TonB-dependent receptor [Sphingomonadales bacterium 56]|uniref:TonB-dependent receptor n=1 Tax=unclassified Sphingobium TaxID=2611147 RepID=UPI00191B613F|nr:MULTISPECIES: TonB-dependent receptor [unclassified Sphingobium]MBY2929824.1 TonB-dependent receptor [Sphingomonadales bacterium 56]MBY2959993.1 TonB-dependent receptor [Sphingomonadales bacterium 58]CAD7340169.1 Pesticin receptor [Sphingobium sp. S6]CAD7340255.1 Pesticin receptor [Sphingobium sp. S8]